VTVGDQRAVAGPHSIAFIPRNTWVSVTNTTPAGRLMFNVIGAMAEFERALIQERVRAGVRNARAKGKRIGRPRIATDGRQVAALRKAGNSWSEMCKQTGLSKGTAQRAYYAQKSAPGLPKNGCGPISSSV
jgi:DNA invertase Pin-like site-specific DNA recombinase